METASTSFLQALSADENDELGNKDEEIPKNEMKEDEDEADDNPVADGVNTSGKYIWRNNNKKTLRF